jgi:hypothetical protein
VNADRPVELGPGDEVVLIEDGTHALVSRSEQGCCVVKWLDEDPEEFGGSVVANERLRLFRSRRLTAAFALQATEPAGAL